MCDTNSARRSRRKQYTPSRRFSIGTAAVLRVPDEHGTGTIDGRAVNDQNAVLKQDQKNSHLDGNDVNPLECEPHRLQGTEPMQRLSPSTASSTPSSSASVDSASSSSDTCRKESPCYQYINPLHALYLPVAFHNNTVNSIQVLGYPQVLIPVAIHRDAQDVIKPCLFIDEFMARNITVPKQICFGEAHCNLEITAIRQHRTRTAYSYPSTSSNVPNMNIKKRKETISNGVGKRRISNDSKPLDLTIRMKQVRHDANNNNNNNINSSNSNSAEEDNLSSDKVVPCEPDKKYRCDCGVSFNSEVTLNGHKKYYCNNNAKQAAPFRKPQKKVAYHCQQCDFLPASASQLAQHIRVNHATVQAYVCQICGYKGYSQRGIRSHLRTHVEYADEKTEDLLNSRVQFVTAETKTVPCSNCFKD